jgi:hypothetical protein
MKKILLSLAFATMLAGTAVAQQPVKTQTSAPQVTAKNGPAMTLENAEHNFGDIKQGDVVEHTFVFKNTGNQPLIIDRVEVSCGCTTPSYTKEPVMPGKTGTVTAKFDSAGKLGLQKKPITIHSNSADGVAYVYIVTDIKEKTATAAKVNK